MLTWSDLFTLALSFLNNKLLMILCLCVSLRVFLTSLTFNFLFWLFLLFLISFSFILLLHPLSRIGFCINFLVINYLLVLTCSKSEIMLLYQVSLFIFVLNLFVCLLTCQLSILNFWIFWYLSIFYGITIILHWELKFRSIWVHFFLLRLLLCLFIYHVLAIFYLKLLILDFEMLLFSSLSWMLFILVLSNFVACSFNLVFGCFSIDLCAL